MNHSQAAAFRSAGYEDININSSYVGGQVRQHGNFSFSRVYQASGSISATQPETAYRIFQRAIAGLDIAGGTIPTTKTTTANQALPGAGTYSSKGSRTASRAQQEPPPAADPTCYILDTVTCTDKAYSEVFENSGVIHRYILLDEFSAHLFPDVVAELTANGKSNLTTGKIGDMGDDGRGTRTPALSNDSESDDGDGGDSAGPGQPSDGGMGWRLMLFRAGYWGWGWACWSWWSWGLGWGFVALL